jgi:Arc/MetJ-type ribon-helix-helix transcriptional regulator
MAQWTLRLPDELAQQIRQASEQRGFSSPRAFIRDAIRKELQVRGEAGEQLEARIAASLDRLGSEIQKLGTAHQAQFALTDALAKVILMCLPEPPKDVADHARSRAMLRYDKFIKSVAASMVGSSRVALTNLVSNGK